MPAAVRISLRRWRCPTPSDIPGKCRCTPWLINPGSRVKLSGKAREFLLLCGTQKNRISQCAYTEIRQAGHWILGSWLAMELLRLPEYIDGKLSFGICGSARGNHGTGGADNNLQDGWMGGRCGASEPRSPFDGEPV